MAKTVSSRAVLAGPKFLVRHATVFEYSSPVTNSNNELRLEPREYPFQKTLSCFIKVLPATRIQRFKDLFGNVAHHFEIAAPHRRLAIESRVKVMNLPLVVPQESKEATTEEYDESGLRDTVWVFLQESRYVSRHPEIWRQAVDLVTGIESVFVRTERIMEWVHDHFRYQAGATGVNTHLEEAFRQRSGVCQDFSHVMIGMCRSVGIPARYASGYLFNGPRDHLVGAQASHAWVEVYFPFVGWVGFDPTNRNLADERYVKIAVGRDYDDVAPVKGSYHGSGGCRLEVSVEVEKIG